MRDLITQLLDARAAGIGAQGKLLLADEVSYWDCVHDQVTGREAVWALLTCDAFEVETIAASPTDAVVELQVVGTATTRHRVTEVHRGRDGVVREIRAYLDPSA